MNLIKTSLFNGVAVIIKMATLLGINKVLALYVGPSGYAALGQLQNALTMITTLSSGAVNTGVTKYTAEYIDQPQRQHAVWRTSTTLALIGSIFVGVLVALFSVELSSYFFKTEVYSSVFIWVALSLFFFTFNALLLAVINGKKDVKTLVVANIAGSFLSLIVTGILTWTLGLYGALVSLGIYQALAFVTTVLLCRRSDWFRINYFFGSFDKKIAIDLSKFAAMALTTAACVPVAQILIRSHLIEDFGVEYAGYWEAMWRLSSTYLLLVTTTLSVYYLPRLSELVGYKAVVREVMEGYKFILPMAVICCIAVYLLRDFVIQVLFSSQFLPMRDLFAFQLIGDVMKIGSWILAYVMLGKAMYRIYIVTEIAFAISLYGFVLLFTRWHGFEGVVEGYAFNYLLYWVVMFCCVTLSLKHTSDTVAGLEDNN